MSVSFIFPSDFREAVENDTGQSFNEDQAHSMCRRMQNTCGGRALLAAMTFPLLQAFLEHQAVGADFGLDSPRMVICFPGDARKKEVPV